MFFFFIIYVWKKDVIMEGLAGYHNNVVDVGFKKGFVIFLLTEFMFFFGLFWYFFDKFLLGNFYWWVDNILDCLGLPLFGTFLLLLSSLTCTYSHRNYIIGKNYKMWLFFTIVLGLFFLCVQLYEYKNLFFNISDGVVGRVFFFLTGFHGMHVILGVIILFFSLVRMHIMLGGGVFFEVSVIYWHFVDVVWLFLFVVLYV